ncbi:MAG: (d)CMP kinase [Candidatus Bipolaricaulota bacterium]|nr:(d)CMP kinase [Candidatus Bipolaricaulota bacterium]
MQIAIDGPAAAGKTSLGIALARHFHCLFVETGKMYRAVALGLSRGLGIDDINVTMEETGRVLVNGSDVTGLLYTPTLDQAASRVAVRPEVRARLVALQRRIAADRDVVMEGRDIGTVVLPAAEVKIFLQASPQNRAQRRVDQRPGADLSSILREIRARDSRDSLRKLAPLNPAEDAIIIDTDQKSLAEVISEAIDLVKERLKGH